MFVIIFVRQPALGSSFEEGVSFNFSWVDQSVLLKGWNRLIEPKRIRAISLRQI